MMVSTVQEGCGVIADAAVEKRTKARGPGCPQGTIKTNQTPAASYNMEEWMQGLEEDASEVGDENGGASNCRTEWRNVLFQCMGRSRRWCRRQGAP